MLKAKEYFKDKQSLQLVKAIEKDEANVLESLINNNNIDLNSLHGEGVTFLIWSVLKYSFKSFCMLLNHGADINLFTKTGETAFCVAVMSGLKNFVEEGIKRKANINQIGFEGNPPILVATTFNQLPIAKLLIENGADINAQGKDGTTPLIIAVDDDNEAFVKLLLKNNTDINIKHPLGFDAKSLAQRNGKKKIIDLLNSKV